MRRFVLGVALALGFTAAFAASTASAHSGTIAISCTQVTFSYTSFPYGGSDVTETISIDGTQLLSQHFQLGGSTGSHIVTISVPSGTHTVTAHAEEPGGSEATATQTLTCGTPPPCPTSKINFRWHYSANGSSGSWSATQSVVCPGGSISIGPQAMEGDMKIAPGATLKVGYDFTLPGNKSSLSVTVNNPKVVFIVRCVSGAAPSQSTFTVPMVSQTYSVTNDQWYPSGDQKSPLVYQGSIAVPNLCGGGQLRLDKGGTFSASVGGYSATVLATAGLIDYWRLGESAGTVAFDSKGGNNGSYQSGTTLGLPGALVGDPDTAVGFDGVGGSVQVPHSASLNVGDRFTIEAWVKRGSLGGATNQVIASKQDQAWVLLFNTSNQLVLRKSNVADLVASTVTVADTAQYHYVVATKDGPAVHLYVDGVDVTGTVTNQAMADNALPLAIGQSSSTAFFNGAIDEVALYNVTLTGAQVSSHYSLGKGN